MNSFQRELAEIGRMANIGNDRGYSEEDNEDYYPQSIINAANDKGANKGGRKSDQFSHEQLLAMYSQLMNGQIPQELQSYYDSHKDANGKPIIDEEGGAMIQPEAGFVVKTKDKNGQKVFINMTSHELVDPFEEKPITQEEATKLGTGQTGLRIPLSLGAVKEDNDKKGHAA